MTCIVGIEQKDCVFIGADSASSNGHLMERVHEGKVFTNGPFIVGYTTSFRFGNLLEHAWKPPEQPRGVSDHAFLCTTVVDSIRECLKAGGYATKNDEAESGGTCLIGYRARLYRMQDEYSILRQRPFGAAGSGQQFALGALHASTGNPETRLRVALKAAATCCATVIGPFVVKVGGFKRTKRRAA